MSEQLQLRVYGDAALPTLVYLPGLHGDWTLGTGFRVALAHRVRFVEITYPRSLTWSLEDYANAIESALLSQGISKGWIIGESWGSQPAWMLTGRKLNANGAITTARPPRFEVTGLILAGGFVKHPWKWGPGLLRWLGEHTPGGSYRLELKFFAWYAGLRHHQAPECLASIGEFVARRTNLDRQAMRQRLDLLDSYDPRAIARETRVPVHYLAGLLDPLVPWVLVRWWLRRNCPGYRGGKTFWLADHNILATASVRAADLVVRWMAASAI